MSKINRNLAKPTMHVVQITGATSAARALSFHGTDLIEQINFLAVAQ
jgi:hypothetical protein